MSAEEMQTSVMHKAALDVIANYQSTGEPFALFLSSWSSDAQSKEVLELLKELDLVQHVPENVQFRIGVERRVRVTLQFHGLQTVAVYRQGDAPRIAMPGEWPAFSLTDDEWQSRVRETVAWADLIAIYWGAETPGLGAELAMCGEGSNPLKTVLIVKAAPRDIYLSQIVKTYPRVVPTDELELSPVLHPEFVPLIKRMKKIQALEAKRRTRFVDPEKRLKRFPLPATSRRFEGPIWIEGQ